uniref:thioredoxin domain-containing protein 16 n=1 Tax=Myxine glutinosa TaxID=7769 RepID=UPI00358FE4E2
MVLGAVIPGWISISKVVSLFLVLLCCCIGSGIYSSSLPELTPDSFSQMIGSPHSFLVHLRHKDSPRMESSLQGLPDAAQLLTEYKISVWQMDCQLYSSQQLCKEANDNVAYFFRMNRMPYQLSMDSLFDVDSIVANTLNALLVDEVKLIQDTQDLHLLQETSRGLRDVVFAYLKTTGSPEHRAFMEGAFIYGDKFTFALSCNADVLKVLMVDPQPGPQVWYLHCQEESEEKGMCGATLFHQNVSLVNLLRFFKLVLGPPFVELHVPPAQSETPFHALDLPEVFLLSHRETYKYDVEMASKLARALLGSAGILLLHCDEAGVKVPSNANVAYRGGKKDDVLHFLTLASLEAIINYVRLEEDLMKKHNDRSHMPVHQDFEQYHNEEEREDEDDYNYYEEEEDEDPLWLQQDDEVAVALTNGKPWNTEIEVVPALTDKSFAELPTLPGSHILLFYFSWDIVSQAFLPAYVEVTKKVKEMAEQVSVWRVDCRDWTDVCSKAGISRFPSILLMAGTQPSFPYHNMLAEEALLSWIKLSISPSPSMLDSLEETLKFLGLMGSDASATVLTIAAVLTEDMKHEAQVFMEVVKMLRGKALVGLCHSNSGARNVSTHFEASLPLVLVNIPGENGLKMFMFPKGSAEDVILAIENNRQPDFPELTTASLPDIMRKDVPLLVLFLASPCPVGSAAKRLLADMHAAGHLENHTLCWMDVMEVGMGRSVLETYIQREPQLPEFVRVHLGSNGDGRVHVFPPQEALNEATTRLWLRQIKDGLLLPTTILDSEPWDPPHPGIDFLAIMDSKLPGFAHNKWSGKYRPPTMRNGDRITVGSRKGKHDSHPSMTSPISPAHIAGQNDANQQEPNYLDQHMKHTEL